MIRHRNTFTPRELFSRMQGAWFEPRQGSMWQENTGVTPTTSGGQTIGKLVDLSAARVASQATAANRPIYQLDSKSLPYLAHDSTDVLTASLPAINVRRNLLKYSEQFDNAAWNKNNSTITSNVALAPNGEATADKLTKSSASGNYADLTFSNISINAGVFSIYVKKAEHRYFYLRNSGIQQYVIIDLNGGAVVRSQPYISVNSVNTIRDGWYRIICSVDYIPSGQGRVNIASANSIVNDYVNIPAGDDTSGIYIWGAQLELGSVATPYQKITDWTSEQYSSSGSVYFATPSGMSCLHNQSIGTTYNLPAPQTDIYGVVITPARLPPPLEQRLALYMHRLAGLADADFFWQEQATDGMTGQLLADDNDTILLRA